MSDFSLTLVLQFKTSKIIIKFAEFLIRQGKIHRHWLSPIFSSFSPSFFSREVLTYMRLPLASYS